MSLRIHPLDARALELLPAPCRWCLCWEQSSPPPDPRDGPSAAAADRKAAWISARVAVDGVAGAVAERDGRPVGFALFAPARAFAPRGALFPTPSPDALLLATVYVEPGEREVGVGRALLRAAIKAAAQTRLEAVEAYGDRRHRERACTLPVGWLLHVGFVVHREHVRLPLLRLEVRRTLRWEQPRAVPAASPVLARRPA